MASVRADGAAGRARLRLIGGFHISADDGPEIAISSRRGCALFAYLHLSADQASRRDRLYGLLWSDRGEAQARASLRQCLFELRQALEAGGLDLIDVGRDRVALDGGKIVSDVGELQRALAGNDAETLTATLAAVGRGQLLEGLEFGGLYREWLDQARAQFDQTMASGVHAHLARLIVATRWPEARALADVWLQRDPLDETAVAAAIRADIASGAVVAARRRFEALKSALQREFGVAPGEAVTEALTQPPPAARSGEIVPSETVPASAPTAEAVLPAPARPPAMTAQSERRRLTVLSCALVNASQLSSRLDPEQWHTIASRFQRMVIEAVVPMGGFVAKHLPDGLLVYFGYPEAREDAVECGVRAGLAVLETWQTENASLAPALDAPLFAHAGVHVGTVVVAHDGGGEIDVFGDAPQIAQAVRSVSAPGALAMTDRAHEQVSGLFVVEELGTQLVTGDREPVRLYRAIRPGLMGRRGFITGQKTKCVGRDEELGLLMARWRRAPDEGQVVLVTGEAGIGKSRLVEEFRDRIKPDPHLWIECACAPFFIDTPFHPVSQMLRQGLGWLGDEPPEELIRRLEQALQPSGMNLEEAVPLIADLLNLPAPTGYPPLTLNPDQRRARLIAALTGWVFTATIRQPLVIVMEDLQWADPSTLEVIQTLALQGVSAPLLMLCVARPEFRANWPARAHHSQIALGRLSRGETYQLVQSVTASADLSGQEIADVIARADGVPLFAEELSRAVLVGAESGAGRIIPQTLFDSLAARLDRLGPAKEVAQVAAVLGRDFSYELIAAISDRPPAALEAELAALTEAELIFVRGAPPNATYRFKHALIQDAAYEALLISRRRELHAQAAETIASAFPALADAHPEVLARHWSAAGKAGRAAEAWTAAGHRAAARAAHVEAVQHFRAALALIREAPGREAQVSAELSLLLSLAVSLGAARGYHDAQTGAVLAEARAICDALGNSEQLFTVFRALNAFSIMGGDLDNAEDFARRCDQIANATGRAELLLESENGLGYVLFARGDMSPARAHLERAVAIYEQNDGASLPQLLPNDPLIQALGPLMMVLFAMDEDAGASRIEQRLIAHARAVGGSFGLVNAQLWRSLFFFISGDFTLAIEAAEEVIGLCDEFEYPAFRPSAALNRAFAIGHLSEAAVGLQLAREALAELDRLRIKHPRAAYLCQLAGLELLTGDAAGALATVDASIAMAEEVGETYWLSPSHRLRAEILARLPAADPDGTQAALAAALEVACRQGASRFIREAEAAIADLVADA